jgi:hypothetical protein
MAQGVIYMVDGEGLRRMTPSAPENEDRMQELVATYPELITDGDGDLLLIRREHSIGDGEASGRWSLDHLFVTREAVPVLVELKRAVDTRLRREVVGQILDYAANAVAYWQVGTIAESFAATAGAEADTVLADFIGDRDPDDFWGQVDSNLRAGRIKLVFVADAIPRELAIIVEFLNSQMRADVRAVELRWFSGDSGVTTLSPRIIGEAERAVAAKAGARQPPMELASWIAERIAPHGTETLAGVERLCQIAKAAGGEVFIPSTRGSIVAQWPTNDGKHVYPIGVYPSGIIVLRLGYLKYRPAFAAESARRELYDQLVGIVGPLHTKSLVGEPGFAAALLNDDAIANPYSSFLEKVVAVGRQA